MKSILELLNTEIPVNRRKALRVVGKCIFCSKKAKLDIIGADGNFTVAKCRRCGGKQRVSMKIGFSKAGNKIWAEELREFESFDIDERQNRIRARIEELHRNMVYSVDTMRKRPEYHNLDDVLYRRWMQSQDHEANEANRQKEAEPTVETLTDVQFTLHQNKYTSIVKYLIENGLEYRTFPEDISEIVETKEIHRNFTIIRKWCNKCHIFISTPYNNCFKCDNTLLSMPLTEKYTDKTLDYSERPPQRWINQKRFFWKINAITVYNVNQKQVTALKEAHKEIKALKGYPLE